MQRSLGAVLRRVAARRPSERSLLGGFAVASGVTGALVAGVVAWAGATAEPSMPAEGAAVAHTTQQYSSGGGFELPKPKRDRFVAAIAAADGSGTAVEVPALGPAVPAGVAQKYAAQLIEDRGWKPSEFACLAALWGRESGWNAHAGSTSGPYGIPQAYPGSKMASAGGDWVNDHKVQIRWGLGYISGRYGTPCGAWTHWQSAHSY